ncbi:uncharacterized protein NPIL_640061 [Nephila pilipes]|uniref:Uncharacterized protein n=1 Tax=Nephila pilipes TaxID=299642 RepID=A0A8X6IVE9_NEPPI|nr:uncharacterized protein NPIL_640061 [Nephila pilipes]
MDQRLDENLFHQFNYTDYYRGRYPYSTPPRPKIVPMRDLSPASQERLIKEFYDAYDPLIGIRIAIGIGIFLALFAVFLFGKSMFQRSRSNVPTTKTIPSLYLYNDMEISDCELRNISSTGDVCVNGQASDYKTKRNEQTTFVEDSGFRLQEVSVNPTVAALKLHASGKRFSNRVPKYTVIKITENVSRSLPCSPYSSKRLPQLVFQNTDWKTPSPAVSTGPTSLEGSLASFGSIDEPVVEVEKKPAKESSRKHFHKTQKKSA